MTNFENYSFFPRELQKNKTVSDNLIDLFGKVVSFDSLCKSALGVIDVLLFVPSLLLVVRIIAVLILLLLVFLILFLLFVGLFALFLFKSGPLVL